MNVEVPQPETFEGGAEIMQNPDGGATIQALMGEEGIMVQAEQYDHNANLAEVLDEKLLNELSSELRGQYEEDLESRDEWKEGYVKGLDLLGIKYEERTEPFDGASGVTHPLIAESVTQFQAQSYKELLPSGGPVKINIMGNRTLEREAQAARVREFMNYQITEVMEDYDTDTDQMLFYLPLAGSTFKKIYYDQTRGTAVSKFVPLKILWFRTKLRILIQYLVLRMSLKWTKIQSERCKSQAYTGMLKSQPRTKIKMWFKRKKTN